MTAKGFKLLTNHLRIHEDPSCSIAILVEGLFNLTGFIQMLLNKQVYCGGDNVVDKVN